MKSIPLEFLEYMSENFIYFRGRVVHRAASPPRDSSAQVGIFDVFVSDLRMLWAIVGKKLPMTRWSFSRGQRVFFWICILPNSYQFVKEWKSGITRFCV